MQRTPALTPPQPAPLERPRAALSRLSQRLADPAERKALAWQAVWLPFRAWSEVPAPAQPRGEPPVPAEIGLAGEAVVRGIERIRRRLWASHALAILCRGIWLGLAFGALLMLLDVAGGPVFDPRPALVVGGLLVAAALVLAALSRPSRLGTARMLDRTFGLQERLTTALDDLGLGVPEAGQRAPVVYLQMADAANAVAVLRNHPRLRPEIPVREVVLAVLMALILTTLAFARGLDDGLPALASVEVPEFTPAIERPADPEPSAAEIEAAANPPSVQEVLERSDRSSRARRDLQALATALADHAVTRPAAEQIAGGDYAAASDHLRTAASQAGDLSPGARAGLSDDLQQASEQMDPETNGLQEATRDAASGLQQGDDAARAEMRDLADAVERAGDDVVPQGELASQMRSAQQSQAQGGSSESRSAATAPEGEMASSASEFNASSDPGSGADASSSTSAETSNQQGQPGAQPGGEQGQSGESPTQGSGQPGEAAAPGEGAEQGQGAGQAPGEAARAGTSAEGQEGTGDSPTARDGGGAGTGESAEAEGEEGSASGSVQQPADGEAANPEVTTGGSGEADPSALDGANAQVALPAGEGDEGVQTSADGGSALRGSGAGVTAGSGYAVQGEVGQAGPDSNRVPAEHRETVERYFSAGGVE